MKSDWCNIKVSVPWRSSGHFRDLRIWLLDNVEYTDYYFHGGDPNIEGNRLYYFVRKEDAVWFSLMWS